MAVTTVTVKAHDSDTYTATITIDDVVVDLTGATVLFMIELCESPNTSYSFEADIVSAVAGTVTFTAGTGFPTVPGKYKQEWLVSFSDLSIVTFPNDGYNTVIILDDLN